ncbi:MAG: hypothetical protein ACREPI_05300 [Candidatus Dormibacterales bacterium]
MGSSQLYELLYRGHDYKTGKAIWSFYFANFNVRDTFEVLSLDGGEPLAGGEIVAYPGYGTQMQTHGVPSQQVEDDNGVWHTWNTSIITYQCQDSPFNYVAHTKEIRIT